MSTPPTSLTDLPDRGERSEVWLKRIAATARQGAECWYLRGGIFRFRTIRQAEQDFRRTILADNQHHRARGSIGLVKIAVGDLDGARQAFQSALLFDPNNEVVRQNLERLQLEMNRSQPSPRGPK